MNEFINSLKKKGIHIQVDNEDLDIKAPKGAITPEILEEIRKNKIAIIDCLNEYNSFLENIETIDFPLSSSQLRLWFLQQMQSVKSSYNVSSIFEIEGELSIDILNKSFNDLIQRHEILRTTFHENELGNPVQKISNAFSANIQFIDVSNDTDEDPIRLIIEKECNYQFELKHDTLIRFTLIKIDAQKFLCLIVAHHIICDDWSLDIIKRDLFAFYKANSLGTSVVLPVLNIQYRDYALEQQRDLDSLKIQKQESYWLREFQDEVTPITLIETKRPIIFSSSGAKEIISIDSDVMKKFKSICINNGVTNFIGLQALLCSLFYKYTHNTDFTIGIPTTTRKLDKLKDQIGFYVNTIPLRAKFNSDFTFIELLQEVKNKLLEGYENIDYPLDKLVNNLGLERDLSRNPLFDIIITLQERTLFGEVDNLKILNSDFQPPVTSKFDLEFNFINDRERSELILIYNNDIYPKSFINDFLNHLIILLDGIVDEPNNKLYQYDYLSQSQKELVIKGFNDTQFDYDTKETLIDAFEKIANSHPDIAAIALNDGQIYYGELNEKADLLSQYLLKVFQIQEQECIGVSLDRSPELIIALLAILKARAIYVPLDLEYPKERIDYIIDDTKINCVINKDFFDEFYKYDHEFDASSKRVSLPSDIVYIIYTSGTTGNPKGIMMQNQNITNLMQHHKIEIQENGKTSFLSNTSFDVSFQEILSTLLSRGILYPISDTIKKDIITLSQFLSDNQIETLFLPTAYFKILIENAYFIENISDKLKNIIVAGEKLVMNESIFHKLKNSDLKVHNHYGPAETHVVTTLVINTESAIDLIPSIGKPICNTQIYILDNYMNPVGVGIKGKIFIGGKNVSKGYWNNSELTTSKFIQNPFFQGKIYDTGDLGMWLPDGNIQYAGRNDLQVKIRGYRIELEEIECLLLKHINEFDQLVVVTNLNGTENELVAYYVSVNEIDIQEVKSILKSKMPSYMIPSHFIQVDNIPLTPNGKLNKKALPSPIIDLKGKLEIVESRTEVEHKLVEIWKEVLNVPSIGVYDNFFDLGGHSLHITKMIYKINEVFAIKITIEEVFNLQNIQALGKLIDQEVLLKQAMNKKTTDKLEEIWEI